MKQPGEDVTVVAGDVDFAPGDVRYSFLVINHDARPVERAEARVWLAHTQSGRPFERATATLVNGVLTIHAPKAHPCPAVYIIDADASDGHLP